MVRVCNICKVELDIQFFGSDKTRKYGKRYACKKCEVKKTTIRARTMVGLVYKIYEGQKSNSKARGYLPPTYTKRELVTWVLDTPIFIVLYNNWVDSNYNKQLIPSVDRINDYKSYTLDNIQLTTWGINKRRGALDRFNGINNKTNIAVIQITSAGKFINEFYSMAKASRSTRAYASHIKDCCVGARQHAGGYRWKFKFNNLLNNKNYAS